ncbi:MAG: tetraacyldisaccharide 4'-kinase [Pirellulales bacterium]|nr:tetraacyldisaccharide 4'-kinase [Pirellulales bacterium]
MLSAEEFHAIVSGQRRGFCAGAWRCALRVVEAPYAWAMRWRNRRYDRGNAESFRVDVPVISVGNITLGGTGKTPAVEWIARWLRRHDVRVTIVSRGYGAEDGARNDEALELEQKLPDVPHLQNADRVAASQMAIEEFEAQCILLDDGFQHRRLKRDLDIVLLDALEPFGFSHVFPRGLLRESLTGLARADVILLTRCDAVTEDSRNAIRQQASKSTKSNVLWLEAAHKPVSLLAASGSESALQVVQQQKVAAFCGIGNPRGFRHTLESLGTEIVVFREFPDHHSYTKSDVDDLTRWANESSATEVLCTHKDLVKLGVDALGDKPLWAVRIGMDILRDASSLESRLQALFAGVDYETTFGGQK